MAFQDSAMMDESLPPPEASPTGPPPTRGFDPSANPPLPRSDQPQPEPLQEARTDQPRPSPQPPPSAEPYIPSRHDYPHTQWGEDDFILRGARNYPGVLRSPYMPQERDFASLLHNTVMWFGRFGSPYVGIPAIAMGNYASAYWTAYQKGMHERAGTAWQQYQHAQRMMLDRQKQELLEAGQIMALYSDDPHRFEQEMRTLSAKYGDDKYLNAAIAKGPAAVEAWMAAKNGKYLDAAKAAQAQESTRLRNEAERQLIEERKLDIERKRRALKGEDVPEEWRDAPPSPRGGGGATAEPDETTTEDTEPDTTEPDDTSAEPDTAAGTRTASAVESDITGGGAPARKAPGTDVAQAGTVPDAAPGLNPRVKAAADAEVRGIKPPEGVPKQVQGRIAAEAERQNAKLNELMNTGQITGKDEVGDLAKIRQQNPELADDVEATGHYKRLIPSGGQNMYANMENLVRKVYPHWDPSIYKWIDDFRLSSKPEQKMLQSIGVLKGTAEAVFDALKNIDEKSHPLKNWIDYETGRALTGDKEWAEVGQAFYDYVVRSLMAQNGGYKPQATQIKSEMERFPITMGARAIRAMMAATAKGSISVVDTALDLYQDTTHQPRESTPGYNEHNIGWLRALADLDSNTGYTRGRVPVPDDMKPYLGPAGSNIHRVMSSGPMGPPTPPPADKIEAAKKWLNDPKNKNDPDRARIEEIIRGH